MKSFLEYVAADIIRKYGRDLSHTNQPCTCCGYCEEGGIVID